MPEARGIEREERNWRALSIERVRRSGEKSASTSTRPAGGDECSIASMSSTNQEHRVGRDDRQRERSSHGRRAVEALACQPADPGKRESTEQLGKPSRRGSHNELRL